MAKYDIGFLVALITLGIVAAIGGPLHWISIIGVVPFYIIFSILINKEW